MATKKSNIRSMRFNDEVLRIIEAQEGDTFTAKFEKLIFRCVQELPMREQELQQIQELIKAERQKLQHMREKYNRTIRHLDTVERKANVFLFEINNIMTELETM